MASEMVERVQSALNEIIPKWLAEDGSLADDALARAAIEAMREPSLEMMQAGRDEYLRTHRGGVSGMTIEAQTRNECIRETAAYRAMIGASLGEG